MPLSDRQIMQGLNTDAPPERLGHQAFRLRNVVPASPTSVRPRGGTELVAHYQPNGIGRTIVADGLPEDEGNGVLLSVINGRDRGDGRLTHEVSGLFVFRPPVVSAEYDAVRGLSEQIALYGVRKTSNPSATTLKPVRYDYINDTWTELTGVTRTLPSAKCAGACLLPPGLYGTTYYAEGLLAVEFVGYIFPSHYLYVDVFDVATGARLDILGTTIATTNNTVGYYSMEPYPLSRAQHGYVCVLNDDAGLGEQKLLCVRPEGTSAILTANILDFTIFEAAPFPFAPIPAFHLAGGTTSGTPHATEGHVKFFREVIDQATGSGTITLQWTRRYTAADWDGWTTDPSGCLSIQSPAMPLGQTFGNVVAVLGVTTRDATAERLYCANPRIAFIKGGYLHGLQTDPLTFAAGDVLASTPEGAGRITGMTLNQWGEIYVTGRYSLAGSDPNVIEKYAWPDLSTPVAVVANQANGIGSAAGIDAADVVRPIWDGMQLLVYDANNNQFFRYDRDLVFQGKTDGPADGYGLLQVDPHTFTKTAHHWYGMNT